MISDFESVYETIPGNGWLTKEEAKLLYRKASTSNGPILEVGSYQGRSTCLLASLGRQVYAVDPFDGFDSDKSGDEVEAVLLRNLAERSISNVRLFRQKVEDWEPLPCGFAYLDGDHTYQGTLAQIRAAIKSGCRSFCIHDYAHSGGGAAIVKALAYYRLVPSEVGGRMAWCLLRSERVRDNR